MESRKLLPNASYFAFTATPKNKTLEIFGAPDPQADGTVKHRSFHSYTMKQAIEEGFIVDVLKNYTPVKSYYQLAKIIEDDPAFDVKKAHKKLRRYVEENNHAIRIKAEIMVDHFHEQVIAQRKIGGQARAMVVTNGIKQAITYFHAIRDYLVECKSPYRAIVAFSGEYAFNGNNVTEASCNGFPSGQIAERFKKDQKDEKDQKYSYRFLICADKFQTGYDEPLLHAMYVDKTLSGIKAVQTLSRLNRAAPGKRDVFVLDFKNDVDTIKESFADYYRTTILADETDPNRLHDLQADLDNYQVYSLEQIGDFARQYLGGAERNNLDPILDECVKIYRDDLDEDSQVKFKSKAKTFIRTYSFLSAVLSYTSVAWEERSIFLNFLIPKLPTPKEEDLSQGIIEAIDMDSYRTEKLAMQKIHLPDEDAEIEPVPPVGEGHKLEPETDRLSNIIEEFNERFGGIPWDDSDRVKKVITQELPKRVSNNQAYSNAKENSDEQNARIEHDKALQDEVEEIILDDIEFYKYFRNNDDFRRWVTDKVFELTYR